MTRRSLGRYSAPPAAFCLVVLLASPLTAWVIINQWDDFAPIVMDNVFLGGNWAAVAEGELAKWNDVRTINNDHPFLINASPEFSFNENDGDNTMGFLDGASVMSEYNLSYGPAIAWTAAIYNSSTNEIFEADIMFDPALSWSLSTDAVNPFTTTMLHEAGHAQGLAHYSTRLSIMFPNANSPLAATIFSDDTAGLDSRYTLLNEVDVAALGVWHDTVNPRWMTLGPTNLREGQSIAFNNFTWENKGSVSAPGPTMRIVLSDTPSLSPPITVIDSWTQPQISAHDYTTFSRTVTIPPLSDCAVKYAGLFIPSNASWNERHEENNLVVFKNGNSAPAALTLSLARDALEPNDTFGSATPLPAAPYNVDLTIDQDGESDHFSFTLNAVRWVYLTVNYNAALGNVEMVLFDTLGTPIASSTNQTGFNEIRARLNPGGYVLQVYGNGTGSCNRYNFNYLNFECLQDYECDGSATPFCRSRFCSNFTCVNVVPRPCDDGDPCTRDNCVEDHGGYCLFAPDPSLDPDGDGVCASLDCAPRDSQTWSPPAEAVSLDLESDALTLSWDTLAAQAGPGVVYDLLRGTVAGSGGGLPAADICVAGIGSSLIEEAESPDPGQAFWYLVRGRNACGTGSFGSGSDGQERQVAPCE